MKRNFLKCGIGMLMALVATSTNAQEIKKDIPQPLIPDYVADPSVVYFKGTYYLYGTSDIDHGLAEMGPPVVWKSKDLKNWSYKGTLFSGVEWNKPYTFGPSEKKKTGYFRYWAPGVVIKSGKLYHMYPTLLKPDNKLGIYHMIAKKPEGPFKFSNGTGFYFQQPEKEKEEAKPIVADIDGEPFIDDDGQAYLYWRRRKAAKLSKDLSTIEGNEVSIQTKRTGYSEGPFLFKRKGIYYYCYTLSGGANYAYAYMMSKTGPLGPFEAPERDMIFTTDTLSGIWGPGHGNVLKMPGKDEYQFFYLEYGQGGTTRQVYADQLHFNADGTIQPVKVRGTGLSQYPDPKQQKQLHPVAVKASGTRKDSVIKTTIDTVMEKLIAMPPKFVETELTEVKRQFTFKPENAIDGSNATFWQANGTDKNPWYQLDLGSLKKVNRCELYFVKSTLGHRFTIEKSEDGIHWQEVNVPASSVISSPQLVNKIGKTRFIKVRVLSGTPALWEVKLF